MHPLHAFLCWAMPSTCMPTQCNMYKPNSLPCPCPSLSTDWRLPPARHITTSPQQGQRVQARTGLKGNEGMVQCRRALCLRSARQMTDGLLKHAHACMRNAVAARAVAREPHGRGAGAGLASCIQAGAQGGQAGAKGTGWPRGWDRNHGVHSHASIRSMMAMAPPSPFLLRRLLRCSCPWHGMACEYTPSRAHPAVLYLRQLAAVLPTWCALTHPPTVGACH